MKIRQIDHNTDDRIINNDPVSIEMSGLKTNRVPIKPIIKACGMCAIFTF